MTVAEPAQAPTEAPIPAQPEAPVRDENDPSRIVSNDIFHTMDPVEQAVEDAVSEVSEDSSTEPVAQDASPEGNDELVPAKRLHDTQAWAHSLKRELDELKSKIEGREAAEQAARSEQEVDDLFEVPDEVLQDPGKFKSFMRDSQKKLMKRMEDGFKKELSARDKQLMQVEQAQVYNSAVQQYGEPMANALGEIGVMYYQRFGKPITEDKSPSEVIGAAQELIQLRAQSAATQQPEQPPQPQEAQQPAQAAPAPPAQPQFIPESPGVGLTSAAVTTVSRSPLRDTDDAVDRAFDDFLNG